MTSRVINAAGLVFDSPRHKKLLAWAEANNLDANLMPLQSDIVVDSTSIAYEVVALDEEGHPRRDPQAEDRVLREPRTAPLAATLEAHGL